MILVTGGAGYIGSILTDDLLRKGEALRVLDRLYFGEEGLAHNRKNIDLVQGDIRNFDPSVLDGVDSVIHLGGLSNDPTAEYNPKANMDINYGGTKKLAEACREKGVRRFVFASSCSLYDKGLYANDALQDETSEVSPTATYAVAKLKAENLLLEMAGDDFCPVILRQGTVYGFSPRMRYDLVVNTFLKDAVVNKKLKVFCGGEMWRPLVDVTDASKAFICLVEAGEEKVNGQIFNLCHKNYRILELAHGVKGALEDRYQLEIEVDHSDAKTRSYRVSSKKMEQVLNFTPQVSVKDSVEHMLVKIEENGYTDYLNPHYYNIKWMTLLDEMEKTVRKIGPVF
ncbi:MAG: SDR family oxidoreductase [Candidatus Brocadiales bacterium]